MRGWAGPLGLGQVSPRGENKGLVSPGEGAGKPGNEEPAPGFRPRSWSD